MPKICKNGVVKEMTDEQYTEYMTLQKNADQDPTPEERIAQLEEALEMLLRQYGMEA